jgi:UDP-N-acetylglucosamine acyltransferase
MSWDGIHPTAIVDKGADLGRDVSVGPYAVIGKNVKIGDRSIVHPHAVIDGHTTLGAEVEVFPSAAVGLKPQDKKYDGSPTRLVVGDRTVIRECATLQPGTSGGRGTGLTTVGAGCLLMAYTHVAHDCIVGDGVIMANAAQIAGHTVIEDFAILGGVTTVHQFVRIGTRAITGASARILQDVPPYMTADGHPASLFGLNVVGLKRAGFSKETILALKRAYKEIFVRGPYSDARAALATTLGREVPEVARLLAFLSSTERGVTRAGKLSASDDAED